MPFPLWFPDVLRTTEVLREEQSEAADSDVLEVGEDGFPAFPLVFRAVFNVAAAFAFV